MTTVNSAQQMLPAGQMQAGATGAPSGGGGLGPADALRVIKQRKLLISIVFCLLYMMMVGGTFLVWRYAPRYTSTGMMRFVPPTRSAFDINPAMVTKDYISQQLNTEAAGLTDLVTLQDLLQQEEIKQTKFYRSYGDDFEQCLFDLRDMISVGMIQESYLLRISLAVEDRSEATLLVRMLMERYRDRSRARGTDERRTRINALKETEADVERQLTETRRRISDLRADRDMPALESEREVLGEMIAVLDNSKTELLARLADIESQMSAVQGSDPRNLPLSAEMRLVVESDPMLRYYRQQVEAIDIEMDVSRKNSIGNNHRYMRQLATRRQKYSDMELQRRAELVDDMRERQIEMLRQEEARARNMLIELQEQLAERESALRDLDRVYLDYQNLVKDEQVLARQLEQVSNAVRQAEHLDTLERQEGRLEIASLPRDAVWPTRPNFVVYLGGGFVLSALVAVGLAFLRELTDQHLRTPIDVARFGHLSVLGTVPLLDDEEAEVEELELATRDAPHSLVAEAFRNIRAHLTFSGPLESQHTLLITSPRPEDGKTAVAINLAVTFAQGAQRVLLVDCNFRRPGVKDWFKGAKADGLSNVLVGRSQFSEAISHTNIATLDVLTSGPMPPNPAELLGSAQMRELIEHAKKNYDRVIFDGPPCLLISDALVLATQLDAAVMVARSGNSTKGALRRAREQFQRINARVIGAVLNGVQARPGGYFRQQYREFYDYTNEEVVPQELGAGPEQLDYDPPKKDDESTK